MNSYDILQALYAKYGQNDDGTKDEAWIMVPEARSGAGHAGNNRQCDLLAINTWMSRGLQVIGHEVKVSLQDWKRELADPEKAEAFARYCRRWWVVVPAELAKKIQHEVPPAWGLMSVAPTGKITEVVKAPAREPEPIPAMWWVGWMATLDRKEKRNYRRDVQTRINLAVQEDRERQEKLRPRNEQRLQEMVQSDLENLRTKVQQFREATGVDITHGYGHDYKELGALWAMCRNRSGHSAEGLIANMRTLANRLEAASKIVQSSEQESAPDPAEVEGTKWWG